MASGSRAGGGARMRASGPAGTIRKPSGLKPQAGAPKPAKSGWQAVPRGQLDRYRMLDKSRYKLKQSFDRDLSVATGATDRRRADKASSRLGLQLRKIKRIEGTMRGLSNSPNTPNVPVLPRSRRWGERATGRRNLYRRDTPTIKGAKPGGVISKPKPAKMAPKPTGSRTKQQAVRAQSGRRNAVLNATRRYTGMGFKQNSRIRRTDTGMRQGSLIGKSTPLYRYKPVGGRGR